MRLTILGTGTSTGVPQVGCTCPVCTSSDPRDKRLRCSALLEGDGGECILIDCSADFRQQVLNFQALHPATLREVGSGDPDNPHHLRLFPIDALLITHEHADHTVGIDDLRPFQVFGDVCIYAEETVANNLRQRLPYCFRTNKYPGVPSIELRHIRPHEELTIGGISILPLRVMHGNLPILGFIFNNRVAYITDMKSIPEEDEALLKSIDTLIVNGLRVQPHNTHQSISEAVAFAQRVGARQTWLTHFSHSAGLHAESAQLLPENVAFAYDNLDIFIP